MGRRKLPAGYRDRDIAMPVTVISWFLLVFMVFIWMVISGSLGAKTHPRCSTTTHPRGPIRSSSSRASASSTGSFREKTSRNKATKLNQTFLRCFCCVSNYTTCRYLVGSCRYFVVLHDLQSFWAKGPL